MKWKHWAGALIIFGAGLTLGAVGVADAAYSRGYVEGSCNTYAEFITAAGFDLTPANFPAYCPQSANA